MWLLGFLLLPVVLAADREIKTGQYLIKIVNDNLESIDVTGESEPVAQREFNLADLGIKSLSDSSLDNLSEFTWLSLANNSIDNIGDKVFSKLRKLEYLSLAENPLGRKVLNNTFANLRNLKVLNLTNNHDLRDLRQHSFFGLSRSCEIITRGVGLENLNNLMFKSTSHRSQIVHHWLHDEQVGTSTEDVFIVEPFEKYSLEKTPVKNLEFKVCIENGIVVSLDIINDNEILASGCTKVRFSPLYHDSRIHMENLAITGFARGWYRLQNWPLLALTLEDNDLTRITPELLNDLPSSVQSVSLRGNKIELVENGTIDNPHLRFLDLGYNRISEIEAGAFEKLPKIEHIRLNGNRLTDITFGATLPTGLRQLRLGENAITEIPAGALSKLDKLFNLELQNNKITKIGSQSLKGLSSLESLRLGNNNLETIEAGAAQDLKALLILDVSNNSIASLGTGSLSGPESLHILNLNLNKLIEIPKNALSGLSNSLKTYLTMDYNMISHIEPGSFDLPELLVLRLSYNLLTEIDGDSFQGLPKLHALELNENRIAKFKNVAKNLGALSELSIAGNPISRLDNDDLLGLPTNQSVDVRVANAPIEIIEAGVFGDS